MANSEAVTLKIRYKEHREDFKKWLNRKVDRDTAKDYLKYLDRFLKDGTYEPRQISDLMEGMSNGVKKWFSTSFRNYLTYLEEVQGVPSEIIDRFRKHIVVARTGVREVYISDDELREAHIVVADRGDKALKIFKLLVFSGVRLKHAYETLNNFEPENLVIIEEKNIARYPILQFSKGQKRGYFAYMPAEFAKQLEKIRIGYSTAKNLVAYKRVYANSIRKWHYNFLIQNGVPVEVADFIQGRAAYSVGAMHYLAAARQADSFYARVVDRFPI